MCIRVGTKHGSLQTHARLSCFASTDTERSRQDASPVTGGSDAEFRVHYPYGPKPDSCSRSMGENTTRTSGSLALDTPSDVKRRVKRPGIRWRQSAGAK